MSFRRSFYASLVLTAGFASSSAAQTDSQFAQEPLSPRCELLGQLALFSTLDLSVALAQQNGETVGEAIERLDNLTNLYRNFSCNQRKLNNALDCLLKRSSITSTARDNANSCLKIVGLKRKVD